MPITETVRILAETQGRAADGRVLQVELGVDTDGSFGRDRDAEGRPRFWLRVEGESLGPFDHEDEATAAAEARFGARFD